MPANTSGKWRITVLGNMNPGGGLDANGRSINQSPYPDNASPVIGVWIGAADKILFETPDYFPDIVTQAADPVPDTGALAWHINITAVKAPKSSLYVNAEGAPYGAPNALAIYQVTAEPLDPSISSKPGKRRAYFS